MSGNTIVVLITVLIVACILIYRNNQKREREQQILKLKKAFGAIPTKRMGAERYAKVPAYDERHRGQAPIDDITWNDLELTALYHRIDSTQSAAGEEYLYHVLRSPAQDDAEAAALVNPVVTQWMADPGNADTRVQLQLMLRTLGHTGKVSLYDYLDLLDTVPDRGIARDVVCCLLPFAAIAVMAIHVQAGIVCLLAVLCWNMITYYREKGQIEPFLMSFRYILRLLQVSETMSSVPCTALAEDQAAMREVVAAMAGFRRGSGIVMSSSETGSANPVDLILDYLRILLHLDLIKFYSMFHGLRQHRQEIDALLTIVGRIDAEIAIASFRESLAVSCTPVFCKAADGRRLEITDLVHPMLADAVPNSIALESSMLLTGSNASGKSTFLKAAAIAALLAQTVGFAPAASYTAPRFRIYSSMALRDSMQDGDSYFMVEIKSLKRIVDAAAAGGNPVLCCIDEVLRGTNTVERIAASSEILERIDASGQVLCIAATHDLELVDLLPAYADYHFAETLDDQDVTFTYRLQEGRAISRNAIRLLSQIGFDTDITQRAQARAAHYDETGEWQ